MNYFISGGCKNGKSIHAQTLAKKLSNNEGLPLYYVATMIPADDEDKARIERHLEERDGWGFHTIEEPFSLMKIIHGGRNNGIDIGGVFLIDSLTALLSNNMFPPDADYSGDCGYFPPVDLVLRMWKDIQSFIMAAGHVVLVSDSISGDGLILDDLTETYRRNLGDLERMCAESFDIVEEVCSGQILKYKDGTTV